MFCLNFFIWAGFFLTPLYLQNVLGKSALITGALMLFVTGPAALLGTLLGKLCDRFGCKRFLVTGFLFLMVSGWCQTRFSPASSNLWVIGSLFLFGIGWLLVFGPSATSALTSLPKELQAAGAGTFTTLQEIGGTLGLAITGTIFREYETRAGDFSGQQPIALFRELFSVAYDHAMVVLIAVSLLGFLLSLLLSKGEHEKLH